MPFYGSIVVIKRSGADGSAFPLINEECLLGRSEGCDIRIQLPVVSKEHAKLRVKVQETSVFIVALSRTNNTKLNGDVITIGTDVQLFHGDLFTIGDRHFRWEYPTGSKLFQVPRPEASSSPIKSRPSEVPITKRLAELEAEGTPNNRKRVSFGNYISPELFDKDLPPDTPVRKGSVPVSELKKGACVDSPRPGALARSLAIKRSTSTTNTPKRPSVAPSTPRIPEESSPKGVLKRQDNDLPRTKVNSGYRSSPRTSTGSDSDLAVAELDDANEAKTSKIKTTSPRKDVKVLALKTTPAKISKSPKVTPAKINKSPKVTPARTVVVGKKAKTPTLPIKRKSAVSPPGTQDKKRRISAPAKVDLKAKSPAKSPAKTPGTKKTPLKSQTPKTPMVGTPTKGQTPNMKTPVDEILMSSVRGRVAKTPMVATPAKGSTPKITTPKDAILESPKVVTSGKKKTPVSAKVVKTPKTSKTPKSAIKIKKNLYSEALKKGLNKSGKKAKVARVEKGKITKPVKKTKVQVKSPEKKKTKTGSSTGHANSPENIVIGRRTPKVKTVKKTPRAGKTPKSISKKLGVKTPALKSVKKTLWSEVVKKNLGKTPKTGKTAAVKTVAPTKVVRKANAVKDSKTPKKEMKSLLTTGHANSPAPIVITKRKQKTATPVVTKKGRKSELKIVPDNTDYEGVSEMLKTPGKRTPEIVVTSHSSEKRFPKNLSTVETHKRIGRSPDEIKRRRSMGSPMDTPQNKIINRIKAAAPASEKGKRRNSFRGSPNKDFLSQSLSLPGTPGNGDVTNFDFDSVETPSIPLDILVSPLVAAKSPKNDLTDVGGVKKLMRTPRPAPKSPRNVIDDVRGVKKLVATPGTKQKQPRNDLTDVAGVKNLMKSPREKKQPKNDLSDLRGVKKLLNTPKVSKNPKNDLSDVRGVKKMMATPKSQKTPKNELTDLVGVKNILRSPRNDKGPKNDLSNVAGVKALMATPKTPFNSPVANYTDVQGVKKLLKTPGVQPKSPRNVLDDLTGVSDLVKTPKSAAVTTASTSKAGRKRKVAEIETDAQATNAGSAKKKTKVDESTTSRGGKSMAKSSRSPSKTTRGGKMSPKMDIPKFSLEDVEESSAVVKSTKATRGRKAAAKIPVEGETTPEQKKETPATRRGRKAAEPTEEKEETPATKPKRGRKAAEPIEEEKTEEAPASKPKRGRKAAEPIEKEETPATRPKRGRKAVEPTEEKEETPATRPKRGRKAAEPNEEKEETPATKPKRGRKAAVEATSTPAPTGRGRRGVKDEKAVETADKSVTADEPIELPKSTRGRKSTKKLEEKSSETSEVRTTGRRGREKVVEDNVTDTITKKPPKSRLAQQVEEEEKKETAVTPQKGRGRRKKEEVVEAPTPPPKRGRKAKKEEEKVEEAPEVSEVTKPAKRGNKAKVVEEVTVEQVEAAPAKRGKKAKVVEEATEEVPAKRGRRGKTAGAAAETQPTPVKKPAGKKPEPEDVVEQELSGARRTRKKAAASEPEISSPIKPRGRAAAKKAEEKSKSDLEDMSNLGRKKRRPSTSKSPAKAAVEEPAKKTRSRRK